MLGGLALRWWVNAVLGRFSTSTLRLTKGQQIVRAGPYRLVRHPGYGGVLLLWAGAGLASQNGAVAVIILSLMSVAYAYRIKSEDPCCRRALGTSTGATCSPPGDSFPGFIEKITFPGSKEWLLPAEPGARLLESEQGKAPERGPHHPQAQGGCGPDRRRVQSPRRGVPRARGPQGLHALA